MSIPLEISDIIDRLYRELGEIGGLATEGVGLVRQVMSAFPENAILTQYFAYFNTALFFVETSRTQIENTVGTISQSGVPDSVIQEAGEDLGNLLGRVLEVKTKVERLISRLEYLR